MMKFQAVFTLLIIVLIIIFSCNNKTSHLNEGASIIETDALPLNPLLENAITSSINVKEKTMSTFYGNKIAFDHAMKYKDGKYPAGAILYEVTWMQKADSVWYGANIPKEIKSVECISFSGGGNPLYKLYKGHPLKQSVSENETERVAIIAGQKMAVSP